MVSKIELFERIHKIIDDEIEKSKKSIVEKCKDLFDKFLGNVVTEHLKESLEQPTLSNQNINESLNIQFNLEEIDNDNEESDNEDTQEECNGEEIEKYMGFHNLEDDGENTSTIGINGNECDNESDEDVGVYEMEIHDTTYLISIDEPSFIFEKNEDESVGDCVGIMYEDEPYLLTSYKGRKCYLCAENGKFFEYIDDTTIGVAIE